MSVTFSQDNFVLYQLSVGTDFAVPLGMYVAHGAEVGNGTGGFVELDVDYRGNYLWSLEAISATKGTLAADVRLNWLPQGFSASTGFVQMLDMLSGTLSHGTLGRDGTLHLPLSFAERARGTVRCSLQWDVNTDLEVYRGAVWGYYWDHRAVRTSSGPQRPR